jgi:hypothetical protein
MLLILGLTCMNAGALADWTFLVAAADADWYVDHILIRKRGTMAKVWTLQQYANSQPLYRGDYQSSKTQVEIRCHSKQWRVLYFSYYSGPMGSGEQVYAQETAGAWKAVAMDNVSAALFRVGCQAETSRAQAASRVGWMSK